MRRWNLKAKNKVKLFPQIKSQLYFQTHYHFIENNHLGFAYKLSERNYFSNKV